MNHQSDIETLFRRNYSAMHRVAASLLHDDEAARDVVHDTFEALMQGGVCEDVSAGYLLSAVRNRCINRLRHYATRERVHHLLSMETNEQEIDEWPDEDTFAEIREVVNTKLPEGAKRIVTMRFYDGYSGREIAEELTISEDSVYKALRNAILTLRKHLTKHG